MAAKPAPPAWTWKGEGTVALSPHRDGRVHCSGTSRAEPYSHSGFGISNHRRLSTIVNKTPNLRVSTSFTSHSHTSNVSGPIAAGSQVTSASQPWAPFREVCRPGLEIVHITCILIPAARKVGNLIIQGKKLVWISAVSLYIYSTLNHDSVLSQPWLSQFLTRTYLFPMHQWNPLPYNSTYLEFLIHVIYASDFKGCLNPNPKKTARPRSGLCAKNRPTGWPDMTACPFPKAFLMS